MNLSGFRISDQGFPLVMPHAVADDASLGHFLGLLRAANAYLAKFLPAVRRLDPDGTITERDVDTLRMISAHAGLDFSDRHFTLNIAAMSAPQLAVRIATLAGVRVDFSVSAGRPAPETPPPRTAKPPPDATSETAPATPPRDSGSGTGTVLVAIGAVGFSAMLLAALTKRRR